MPNLSIAPYFPFLRIPLAHQFAFPHSPKAWMDVGPAKRFHPICHLYGQQSAYIHSWTQRTVRDLNLASTQVWLPCQYRKIFCLHCQRIVIEELELFHPYLRVTQRFSRYVHELCEVMTVKEAAPYMGIDWKTVKNIDKLFLEHMW